MDKEKLRDDMLALEQAALEEAQAHYREHVHGALVGNLSVSRQDDKAHAELESDLAEAFRQPMEGHAAALMRLRSLDFGPKTEVEEGAVIKVKGRYFVVSVPTVRFESQGQTYIGISPQAPLYQALKGCGAGDAISFSGQEVTVEEIF